MIRKAMALTFTCLFSSVAMAEVDAPFGLTWGMTLDEVNGLGVVLTENNVSENIRSYRTTSLPKNISDAELYSLMFDDEAGLQKVTMATENYSEDIYGTQGKQAYESLKQALTSKYGEPDNSFEYVGRKLWDKADEFYQCLDYEGCGNWVTYYMFDEPTQAISLELEGLGRGVGYISLGYEGPEWSAALDRRQQATSASDKDAL